MEVVALPSKLTPRVLKRKQRAITGSSTRKRLRTVPAEEPDSDFGSGSDSEGDGLAWRPVARPAGAILGGGLDEDGGLLMIEEIDDVDVEYLDAEGGGRIVKLKVSDTFTSVNHVLSFCRNETNHLGRSIQMTLLRQKSVRAVPPLPNLPTTTSSLTNHSSPNGPLTLCTLQSPIVFSPSRLISLRQSKMLHSQLRETGTTSSESPKLVLEKHSHMPFQSYTTSSPGRPTPTPKRKGNLLR